MVTFSKIIYILWIGLLRLYEVAKIYFCGANQLTSLYSTDNIQQTQMLYKKSPKIIVQAGVQQRKNMAKITQCNSKMPVLIALKSESANCQFCLRKILVVVFYKIEIMFLFLLVWKPRSFENRTFGTREKIYRKVCRLLAWLFPIYRGEGNKPITGSARTGNVRKRKHWHFGEWHDKLLQNL